MHIPRSPHPRPSRALLRSAWASIVLALTLVGLAAPPSTASIIEIGGVFDVSCDWLSNPEAVMVNVAAINRTSQNHTVVFEVSNQPDLVVPVGPGTPGNPTIATDTVWIPSSEWVGVVTVGARLGIGSSYVYGPFDYTNPCEPDTGEPQSPVRATEVRVYCNEDEPEPRLFVAAALENDGPDPETVLMELSGRPNTQVSVPGSSFLTAATWWTMAQAGDEVHVVLTVESLDLVIFDGSFRNVCLQQPEPVVPVTQPDPPAAPSGPGSGEVLETATPVGPVAAVEGAHVAGEAGDTAPGVLPRTGASTAALGAVAVLALLTGHLLLRTAGTERPF